MIIIDLSTIIKTNLTNHFSQIVIHRFRLRDQKLKKFNNNTKILDKTL